MISDELRIKVTISVGVACIPQCAGTVQEAIRIADERLLLAKRARNCVFAEAEEGQEEAA